MARPIDFPPPFGATDAIAAPTDPVDERIEVGVLIVGDRKSTRLNSSHRL